MTTTTQAVSIPATRTHTHTDTMTVREWRLRTLERLLIRAVQREYGYARSRVLERRLERVFYELCDLVQERECTCESYT